MEHLSYIEELTAGIAARYFAEKRKALRDEHLEALMESPCLSLRAKALLRVKLADAEGKWQEPEHDGFCFLELQDFLVCEAIANIKQLKRAEYPAQIMNAVIEFTRNPLVPSLHIDCVTSFAEDLEDISFEDAEEIRRSSL